MAKKHPPRLLVGEGRTPDIQWKGLGDTVHLRCNLCRAELTIELPSSIEDWCKHIEAFEKEHTH